MAKPRPAPVSQPGTEEEGKKKKKENKKREFVAYKYSNYGRDNLQEAAIVGKLPTFISWFPNAGYVPLPRIEEPTRIIRPPNIQEHPYTPYEFYDSAELIQYFNRAQDIKSLAKPYYRTKGYFEKYVDQDSNTITILAADSIFTWFQDLFPITHYSEAIGGNDVGKSSIGYTFSCTGYRVVRGTSISGPNYIRVLGSIEPGQCVIIEDEGDLISDDPVKVGILKSGYELEMRIPKTNMNTWNQDTSWFYPYCYKMILAEKSLSEWKAKGLADRTFTFRCRPGHVRYSIKSVVNQTINKSAQLKKLYDDLMDFRKLMLCYRLIHYKDQLPEIRVQPLINRDLELTYPILQLFYGTEAFDEIRDALGYFIGQRKHRRSRGQAAAIYPILKKHVDVSCTVRTSDIWEDIVTLGGIPGRPDDHDYRKYQTNEYGDFYINTLPKFIHDNFGCELRHKEKGGVMIFDDKFKAFDSIYNHQAEAESEDLGISIEVSLKEEEAEGSEGSEGYSECATSNSSINNEHQNDDTHLKQPSEPSDPSGSGSGTIHRKYPHSDIWACENCNLTGDIWFMQKHPCKNNNKK